MKKAYLSATIGISLAFFALPTFATSVVLVVYGHGSTSDAAYLDALGNATTACTQSYRGGIYAKPLVTQTVSGGAYSVTMAATCEYTGNKPDVSAATDFLLD